MEKSLSELAAFTNSMLKGNGDIKINGVNSLENASEHQLTFLANPKYGKQLQTTKAAAVIIPDGIEISKPALVSKNPYADFVKILTLFAPAIPMPAPGIHPSAIVDPKAIIEKDVAIGPLCVVEANARIGAGTKLAAQTYIGANVVIGKDCIIYPQVIIREECTLGDRVILQPGVVIGGDGFGFAPVAGRYHKIPQIGKVIIGHDVEIGANTTIDRAALNATQVCDGAKIDNLVMIAHNVVIGEHTAIAAQTGLSGSTRIGRHVMIAGQVGTVGHIEVGDNVIIGAQSGVTKNIPDGSIIKGYPAKPQSQYMRELAEIGKISDLRKKVKELEARLIKMESHET